MIRRVLPRSSAGRACAALLATALLLLLTASAALALRAGEGVASTTATPCLNCTPWRTINTANGLVDDLGTAAVYEPNPPCANASLADYLEIKRAWIVNDGSAFYFRIELCASASANRTNLRMGGALDCNHNGTITDAWGGQSNPNTGDRKFVYNVSNDQVAVLDGQNTTVLNLPNNGVTYGEELSNSTIYEWQAPMERVYPGCRGSVSVIGLGAGTVYLPSPAPKDQTPNYDWSHPIDYGDAVNPDPTQGTCSQYPTRLGCDGARHGLYTPPGFAAPLQLGSLADADDGTNQNAGATADDAAAQADEDGVAPTPGVIWTANGQGSLDATVTGGSGYLNCWVDWNNNQSWGDAGDKIIADSPVAVGPNALTFSVPAGVTYPNTLLARCRLALAAGQAANVTGAAEFGEVEDHQWYFGATGNRPGPVTVAAGIANGTDVRLSWGNLAANEQYLVLSSAAAYFQPGDAGVTTATDPDNSSPFDVAGIVGAPAGAQFYLVQGQVTSSASPTPLVSAPSNRVGLWEYDLLPGQ